MGGEEKSEEKSELNQTLMGMVLRGEVDLATIEEERGATPEEIARWIARRQIRRALHGLLLVADTQAQVMVARFRSRVVTMLLGLAMNEKDVRVSLGACRELMRVDLLGGDSLKVLRGLDGSEEPAPLDMAAAKHIAAALHAKGLNTAAEEEAMLRAGEAKRIGR